MTIQAPGRGIARAGTTIIPYGRRFARRSAEDPPAALAWHDIGAARADLAYKLEIALAEQRTCRRDPDAGSGAPWAHVLA